MRTYILALTKYGIVAVVIAYTVLSLCLLTRRAQRDPERVHDLTLIENGMILLFQVISYATLFVALRESRYLVFCLLVAVAFLVIFTLYQRLYPFANMPLFNNMCMLLSVGLVIQSRLSFNNAIHQFVIAAFGLVIAFILPLFRRGFHLLEKPKYLYAIAGILILGVVMVLGASTLGANITYTIAGVTFQPSEFVKILYILFLASALPDVKNLQSFLLVSAFAAAHVLILIGSTDLGSALIFYVVYMFMAFMATGWWLILAGCTGLGVIGAVGCYFAFDHIRERVIAFMNPFDDAIIAKEGYQITQSLFAISAGGLWGSGLGQGSAQDIPFVDSDFIFAAVCEELGQIVGVCVILIGISCFLIMMQLAASFADRFYRLTAYGAGIAFMFQEFLTIGGQTKFIPLTGVTLPFISYGGSSILSTLILFTLVESMCILRGEKVAELHARRSAASHPAAGARRNRPVLRRDSPAPRSARQGGYAASRSARQGGYAVLQPARRSMRNLDRDASAVYEEGETDRVPAQNSYYEEGGPERRPVRDSYYDADMPVRTRRLPMPQDDGEGFLDD